MRATAAAAWELIRAHSACAREVLEGRGEAHRLCGPHQQQSANKARRAYVRCAQTCDRSRSAHLRRSMYVAFRSVYWI
eukprot:1729581-Prymnesium_polylepis.1